MEDNEALVQVIRCLSEEQQAKPSLLVAVLDTYCSMPLPADLLQTITADVLQLLPSAEHATLPMLVRFLLESAGADNMADVVRELRAKLRLSSAAPPDSQEDSLNEGTATVACMGSNLKQLQDARSSNDALTLEALRHGLQMRPDVAAGRVTGALAAPSLTFGHCSACTDFQKKASAGQFAEPLLADAVQFAEPLLADTVQGRAAALGGLFDSMLQLADHLARSGDPLAERCGGALYTLLFREFTDAARRQDVVGALLVNAGSGAASEVNCALATLTALATRGSADDPTMAGVGASPLRPFATMIKSLVQYLSGFTDAQADDPSAAGVGASPLRPFATMIKSLVQYLSGFRDARYLSGFTDAQARRVFNLLLLATLTSDDGSGGGGGSSSAAAAAAMRHDGGNDGLDDVHIFIRRIGIIGAVVFASLKAKRNPNARAEATSTLQMLFSSCDDNKELVAFLYDELATSITKGLMDRDLVDWLSDAINDEPLHLFLCEMIEDTGKIADSVPIQYCNGEIEVRIMFDLDPVEIAFNPTFVLDHTEAIHKRQSIKASLRDSCNFACPLLSAMAASERFLRGHMDDLDAPLSCPILLPKGEQVTEIAGLNPATQEVVVSAFYHAANWCRELVNAYIEGTDQDQKVKVMHRLCHLLELEGQLIYMLRKAPHCKPGGKPLLEGIVPLEGQANKPPGAGKKKKAPASKGKGKEVKGKGKAKAKTKAWMSDAIEASVGITALKAGVVDEEAIRCRLRGIMRPLSCKAVLALGMRERLRDEMTTAGAEPCRLSTSLSFDMSVVKLLLERGAETVENMNITLWAGGGGREGGSEIDGVALCREYQEGGVFASMYSHLQTVARGLGMAEGNASAASSATSKGKRRRSSMANCGRGMDAASMLSSDNTRMLLKTILAEIAGGDLEDEDDPFEVVFDVLEEFDDPFEVVFDVLEEFVSTDTICSITQVVHLVQAMEVVAVARVKVLLAQREEDGGGSNSAVEDADEDEASAYEKEAFKLHSRIPAICKSLLARDWSGVEGSKFRYTSSTAGYLIRTMLKCAQEPVEVIKDVVMEILPTLLETNFNNRDPDLQCALVLRASQLVILFDAMMAYTKGNAALARKAVLMAAFKEGHKFIAAIVKTMPFFERCFLAQQGRILAMLKSLQKTTRQGRILQMLKSLKTTRQARILQMSRYLQKKTTRQLQSLCLYAKESSDRMMLNEAPTVRKILETLIYRVRMLTEANGIGLALKVQPLKARNIDGSEIPDKAAEVSSDENDDDDNDDDDEVDEEEEEEEEDMDEE
ncbi:Fanconi anaemia protein FancD2 nuclease-domain-containing protein [Tribonema minus]|uniref:Fanconi anaemia protein FancD2 nuclease-domain-containing protein n=1 Tax=Tribonema minus TaxID=303371 RepID=A0A835YSY6_9STRA|nr:Fanconi anaemia protein FancD2 nuclease-domain-containing protein [Tribonema minus]